MKKFKLNASIKSADMKVIKPMIKYLIPDAAIRIADEEFVISAIIEGDNSRDLNRTILSGLRKMVKKTRMKSEWSCDGLVERYFDYGLRKTWNE